MTEEKEEGVTQLWRPASMFFLSTSLFPGLERSDRLCGKAGTETCNSLTGSLSANSCNHSLGANDLTSTKGTCSAFHPNNLCLSLHFFLI